MHPTCSPPSLTLSYFPGFLMGQPLWSAVLLTSMSRKEWAWVPSGRRLWRGSCVLAGADSVRVSIPSSGSEVQVSPPTLFLSPILWAPSLSPITPFLRVRPWVFWPESQKIRSDLLKRGTGASDSLALKRGASARNQRFGVSSI